MNDERLIDVFETRYRLLRLRTATEATLKLWQIALRHFDRYLERDAMLSDLTDVVVTGFAFWRRQQGVSPATVNKDLDSILALWRWCHRQRLVQPWPNVEREREYLRAPVAWTPEEFHQLMLAAAQQQRKIRGLELTQADVWIPLLLIAYDTGERIGAVIALTWRDVDLQARWIRFPAESRKNRRRDNAVQIHADTAAAIERLRLTGWQKRDSVFPLAFHNTSHLYYLFDRLLRAAGLPADRRHKFHCIRRTVASHYEAAGGNATELLGHAARRTTEAYLDPRIVTKTPPHELLWRPDCGSWTKGRKNKKGPNDAK